AFTACIAFDTSLKIRTDLLLPSWLQLTFNVFFMFWLFYPDFDNTKLNKSEPLPPIGRLGIVGLNLSLCLASYMAVLGMFLPQLLFDLDPWLAALGLAMLTTGMIYSFRLRERL